jgi:hypothetical protein
MSDVIDMKKTNPIWDKIAELTLDLEMIDETRDPKTARLIYKEIDVYLDEYNNSKKSFDKRSKKK